MEIQLPGEGPAYDKLRPLLTAMATYGGYAQTFFKSSFQQVDAEPVYNLLAEYGLSKADVSGITQSTVDGYLFNKGEKSNGLTLKSADAELQAAINMIMLFEMDAQYSVGDFSAVAISPTGARTEVKIEYNNHYGRYAIVVDDIPAMYWDNDYRVEITNNVTGVTNTVSGSVMAVVRLVMKNQGNPQAVKELVAAMYVYGTAATVKFGR